MRFATHALVFAAGTGLALALTLPHWGGSLLGDASPAVKAAAAAPGAGLPLPQAPLSFAPLVDAASPAVVSVFVSQEVELRGQQQIFPNMPFFFGPMPELPEGFKREGSGSGFLIAADGTILTNNHVVEDASEVKVQLADGTELAAKVLGTDPEIDVALIKVEAKAPLPFLELGSSETLDVGDWVVAIGNPLELDHTVTAGIVSAKGRVIGATSYDDFIQTDASINPGNSGGPLLDTAGRVVGINTAISRMGQGIAFAVPIDIVKELVDELREDGRVTRGWLGISMQPVDADMAAALGLPEASGALVSVVHDGTPAQKAGLKPGDVVLSLEGEEIADNTALLHAVGRHRPEERVRLELLREGKRKTVEVVLGARPSRDALARGDFEGGEKPGGAKDEHPDAPQLSRLGVELQPGAQVFGAPRSAAGRLVVTGVDGDGPAEGKLAEGDVLLQVAGRDVDSLAAVEQALAQAGEVVLLCVERRGTPLFVAVRPKR